MVIVTTRFVLYGIHGSSLLKFTFSVAVSPFELRKKLEARRWNVNEPFLEYYVDKRNLAMPLKLSEAELVDYLIEGIPDVRLRNQARISRLSSEANLFQAFKFVHLQPRSLSNVPVCYNCAVPGHIAINCGRRQMKHTNGAPVQRHSTTRKMAAVNQPARIAVVKRNTSRVSKTLTNHDGHLFDRL